MEAMCFANDILAFELIMGVGIINVRNSLYNNNPGSPGVQPALLPQLSAVPHEHELDLQLQHQTDKVNRILVHNGNPGRNPKHPQLGLGNRQPILADLHDPAGECEWGGLRDPRPQGQGLILPETQDVCRQGGRWSRRARRCCSRSTLHTLYRRGRGGRHQGPQACWLG